MIVLGIETSCDDTGAAVYADSHLLSNCISSQLIHRRFGGVVPELASRSHIRLILPVLRRALEDAGCPLGRLDGIAVTCGPGLAGSLLVGLSLAKGLALSLGLPLIGINHLEGHLMAVRLEDPDLEPPLAVLIVSGGHTQIVLVQKWGEYQVLGRTRDDAAGEAFDKVAKLLGLGYPGGPEIERAANQGDSNYIRFPRALEGEGMDFSFSGLKTAVLNHVKSRTGDQVSRHIHDICRCFQDAVVDVLVAKTVRAAVFHSAPLIVLAGGVAVNGSLRSSMQAAGATEGIRVFWPSPAFCTDNAAMVALTGAFYLERGITSSLTLSPQPSLNL